MFLVVINLILAKMQSILIKVLSFDLVNKLLLLTNKDINRCFQFRNTLQNIKQTQILTQLLSPYIEHLRLIYVRLRSHLKTGKALVKKLQPNCQKMLSEISGTPFLGF